MIEFSSVAHPVAFPQACVCCLSQKGPLLDSHREVHGFGHIYVCEVCVKTGARLFGYAPGKRMDELSEASGALEGKEREVENLLSELGKAQSEAISAKNQAVLLKVDLDDAKARIRHIEGRLREEAEIALSLVGESAS